MRQMFHQCYQFAQVLLPGHLHSKYLQDNTTFRFSSLIYSLYVLLYFSATSLQPTKMPFYSLIASFFSGCLVLYFCACVVENPEISWFCVSKIRAVRRDHKRVKKIETYCCSVTQTISGADLHFIHFLESYHQSTSSWLTIDQIVFINFLRLNFCFSYIKENQKSFYAMDTFGR